MTKPSFDNHITALKVRHRELDELIKAEQKAPSIPSEVIAAHKRQKMAIKMQIAALQNS